MTHILTKHSLEVVDNSEVIHGYLDYVSVTGWLLPGQVWVIIIIIIIIFLCVTAWLVPGEPPE